METCSDPPTPSGVVLHLEERQCILSQGLKHRARSWVRIWAILLVQAPPGISGVCLQKPWGKRIWAREWGKGSIHVISYSGDQGSLSPGNHLYPLTQNHHSVAVVLQLWESHLISKFQYPAPWNMDLSPYSAHPCEHHKKWQVLFIIGSWILKSPIVIVEGSVSLHFCQFVLRILEFSCKMFIISSKDGPFCHYKMSFFFLEEKCHKILSYIIKASLVLFWLLLA